MFPVADDFAAIAKRLKEIQSEAAKDSAEVRRQADKECQPASRDAYEDIEACA